MKEILANGLSNYTMPIVVLLLRQGKPNTHEFFILNPVTNVALNAHIERVIYIIGNNILQAQLTLELNPDMLIGEITYELQITTGQEVGALPPPNTIASSSQTTMPPSLRILAYGNLNLHWGFDAQTSATPQNFI
ncbi:hypothetical protein COLO4_20690 [Corchorus olitorius]|uniref:Uncharacterized protein n=1 Tax=Corchorus olitorius TaxID=93759 RepID=A0A1R3IXK8_9ROSI|nr:hypothetical protein COLO4_20690 [Corchorus olitorius]